MNPGALMKWLALQVEGMLTPSEGGLQAQLLEIMRMLLDSETMDTVSSKHWIGVCVSFYMQFVCLGALY